MTPIKLPLIALVGALALSGCASKGGDAKSASSMPADQTSAGTSADTAMPATDTSAQAMAPDAMGSTGANPTVGGAAMMANKTIVENASMAPNLSTLVAAVKAAGLVQTLSGPGPFTVFAPTNDAFGRLAPGTVDTLLKPANKATLVKVLTYHVVPGNVSGMQLKQMITAGGGTARLTTVEGEPLMASLSGGVILLTDVNGNKSYVETADVKQSNGVVHVVNGVVLPKLS